MPIFECNIFANRWRQFLVSNGVCQYCENRSLLRVQSPIFHDPVEWFIFVYLSVGTRVAVRSHGARQTVSGYLRRGVHRRLGRDHPTGAIPLRRPTVARLALRQGEHETTHSSKMMTSLYLNSIINLPLGWWLCQKILVLPLHESALDDGIYFHNDWINPEFGSLFSLRI